VMDLFRAPAHPYTQGLLNSIPILSRDPTGKVKETRLEPIPGIVPSLFDLPKGCRFQERCKNVALECKGDEPLLRAIPTNREVRCVKSEIR
jgi:peptide/nickel transport system ATP-binding protein